LQFLAPIIRFDCTTKFKKEPFAQAHYASVSAKTAQFAKAQSRFGECRAIAERQHAPAKDRQSREQREE
jgi:hypothetical protein